MVASIVFAKQSSWTFNCVCRRISVSKTDKKFTAVFFFPGVSSVKKQKRNKKAHAVHNRGGVIFLEICLTIFLFLWQNLIYWLQKIGPKFSKVQKLPKYFLYKDVYVWMALMFAIWMWKGFCVDAYFWFGCLKSHIVHPLGSVVVVVDVKRAGNTGTMLHCFPSTQIIFPG